MITKIAEGIAQFSTDTDILGDAYEYLIGEFAAGSGQKAGEFYTPQQLSSILSGIVTLDTQDPKSGMKKKLERVLDFACGSGSLLLNVRHRMKANGGNIGKIYGQEKNITTYNLARMNMLLHGVKDSEFEIHHGDSLLNDWDMLNEMNPAKKWSSMPLSQILHSATDGSLRKKWAKISALTTMALLPNQPQILHSYFTASIF